MPRLLLAALDSFVYVEKKLESNKMTGSLVVPLTLNLSTTLTDVLGDLREPAPDEVEADVSQARPLYRHASRPFTRISTLAEVTALAA